MKRRIPNNQTMILNQTTPLRSRHVRYTIVDDDGDDSGDTNNIMIRSQNNNNNNSNNNNIIELSSSSTTTNTNTSIHKMKEVFSIISSNSSSLSSSSSLCAKYDNNNNANNNKNDRILKYNDNNDINDNKTATTTIEKSPPLESFKVITNIEYRGMMMNGKSDKRLEPVKTMTMKELKILRISAERTKKCSLLKTKIRTILRLTVYPLLLR